MSVNVGSIDRILRIVVGLVLLAMTPLIGGMIGYPLGTPLGNIAWIGVVPLFNSFDWLVSTLFNHRHQDMQSLGFRVRFDKKESISHVMTDAPFFIWPDNLFSSGMDLVFGSNLECRFLAFNACF